MSLHLIGDLINLIIEKLPGKTVLMITHNMCKLRYFDKVIFFGRNKVVDGGNFENICRDNNEFFQYYCDNFIINKE